jgi:hypothetical protein
LLSSARCLKNIGHSAQPSDWGERYERNIITPSIEVAAKIADALDVSIDFLVGKSNLMVNKDMLDRLEDIAKLSEEKRSYVFGIIDMCLRDFKAKRAYSK